MVYLHQCISFSNFTFRNPKSVGTYLIAYTNITCRSKYFVTYNFASSFETIFSSIFFNSILVVTLWRPSSKIFIITCPLRVNKLRFLLKEWVRMWGEIFWKFTKTTWGCTSFVLEEDTYIGTYSRYRYSIKRWLCTVHRWILQ